MNVPFTHQKLLWDFPKNTISAPTSDMDFTDLTDGSNPENAFADEGEATGKTPAWEPHEKPTLQRYYESFSRGIKALIP